MSALTYPDIRERGDVTLPNDWEQFLTYPANLNSYDSGYLGMAYLGMAWRNSYTNQIVIAHKGTYSKMEIVTQDILKIFFKHLPSQAYDALSFMDSVAKKAAEEGYKNQEYYNTGHSLGAIIAEFVGATNRTFVIDFESPGSLEIIINYIIDFVEDFEYLPLPDDTFNFMHKHTVTYNSAPNIINTCNTHFGTIYRLYPLIECQRVYFPTSFWAYKKFSSKMHEMDTILKLTEFDTNGYPIKYVKYECWEWPTATGGFLLFQDYDNYPEYFESCAEKAEENAAKLKEEIKKCGKLKNFLSISKCWSALKNMFKVVIGSWGDPHLITIDGFHYDFQKPGEYDLIVSADGSFRIQVREQLIPGSTTISLNTAVATILNDTRIEFRLLSRGNRIVGITNQNGTLEGFSQADVIIGNGGCKEIFGFGGNDQIYAGSQYQLPTNVKSCSTLHGGPGADSIYGGYSADDNNVLIGNSGSDYIEARNGFNTIYGNEDNGQVTNLGSGILRLSEVQSFGAYDIFGYYIKDSNGSPLSGQIIWPYMKSDSPDFHLKYSISNSQLGFFLIPSGYLYNEGLASGDYVTFKQVNSTYCINISYMDYYNCWGNNWNYSWAVFKDNIMLEGSYSRTPYYWPQAWFRYYRTFAFFSDVNLNSYSINYVDSLKSDGTKQCWYDRYAYWGYCAFILNFNITYEITTGDTIVCGAGNDTIIYRIGVDGVDLVKKFNISQDKIFIYRYSNENITLIERDGGTFILITSNNSIYGGIQVESVSPTDIQPCIEEIVPNYRNTTSSNSDSSNYGTTLVDSVLFINGTSTAMISGELLFLSNGFIYAESDSEYLVETEDGDGFHIQILSTCINIWPLIRNNISVSGLLGTYDRSSGNYANLVLRNGTKLPNIITTETLYGIYADSWRITPKESLFTYISGQNTYTFNDSSFQMYYQTIKDYSMDAVNIAKTQAIAVGYDANSPLFNDVLLEILAGGIDVQVAVNQIQSNLTAENYTNAKYLEVINPSTLETSTRTNIVMEFSFTATQRSSNDYKTNSTILNYQTASLQQTSTATIPTSLNSKTSSLIRTSTATTNINTNNYVTNSTSLNKTSSFQHISTDTTHRLTDNYSNTNSTSLNSQTTSFKQTGQTSTILQVQSQVTSYSSSQFKTMWITILLQFISVKTFNM